jgi:hypothetical protein
MSEEELELGRILGGASKRGKVAERVRELAKLKGKKPSEIVEEAIEIYDMVENLALVDSKCLMLGLALTKKLLIMSTETIANVAKLFTSELAQQYLGALLSATQSKSESSQIGQDLKQQLAPLVSTTMSLMLNLITSLMNSLTGAKLTQQQQQLQGVKIE